MSAPPPADRLFNFIGADIGNWRVIRVAPVVGETLPAVPCLSMVGGTLSAPPQGWHLRGITSNERYVTRPEKTELVARQEGLGRTGSTHAALIPIRKSAAWWAMTQDERRDVLEAQSQHIRIGLRYLPAIARRLHHCRDLGTSEPFDFLTWFEYSAQDLAAFEELVAALRASPEWNYVEREVDVRMVREV
ncbi:chlorite dismutase family protein [Uliginosibacterium sp. H1]|uniref:chlorite dismutase family protein n=1 Tax=Uliginosibacterium sp. H1 TaxID=3114757 RepID=UPI002E18081C|nr:chlorite dismutase family protein [Uliginosibacterium sp. H1]